MDFIRPSLPFFGVMTSYIGGRKENQDTCGYSETERGLLVVVCDGMGGGPGGKTASRTAVEAIINYVKASCVTTRATVTEVSVSAEEGNEAAAEKSEDIPADVQEAVSVSHAPILSTPVANAEILREAIQAANTALRDCIKVQPKLNGMGTTVTAMLINKEGAAVAHVGDSRIYQLRHKKIVFRTSDHSEVGKMVRSGVLTEEQARLSAMSNIITRALGIGDAVDVDTATLTVEAGDRFVLCTDGVWGSMPEPELVKMFCQKGDIDSVARKLNNRVEEAGIEKGGHHDNFSMIMLLAVKELDNGTTETPRSEPTKVTASNGKEKGLFTFPQLSARAIAICVTLLIIATVTFIAWHSGSERNAPAETHPADTNQIKVTQIDLVVEEIDDPVEIIPVDDQSSDNADDLKKDNAIVESDPTPTTKLDTPAADKAKEQVAPATNRNETISPDSAEILKKKLTCYNETINVLETFSAAVSKLKESENPSEEANKSRKKTIKMQRDAILDLEKKYSEFYTQEDKERLFSEGDEKRNRLAGIYGALGEEIFYKREGDWKSKIEGPYNMIMNKIRELNGSFNKRREEVNKQLTDYQLENLKNK